MIAAGEPREFIPYGREHVGRYHPGKECFPAAQAPNKDLLLSSKQISFDGSKDFYMLKRGTGESDEEELFVWENVVVWSKSNGQGTNKLHKSFTFENPVQRVTWCDTFISISIDKEDYNQDCCGACICVLESTNIHILSNSGHIYVTPLPFPVSNMWPSKYGLILDRKQGLMESGLHKKEYDLLPTVFNLLHPRDEITPVVTSHEKVSYFLDKAENIVYCFSDILVTHNSSSCIHTVWRIRYATTKEQNDSCSTIHESPMCYSWGISPPVGRPTTLTPSPCQRHHLISPQLRTHSPLGAAAACKKHMAALSRQSPLVSSLHQRFNFTPSSLVSSTRSQGYSSRLNLDSVMSEMGVPLHANICFQYLWNDKHRAISKSEKVFFSTDVSEQKFLCLFLKEERCMRLIRMEETNDPFQLVFGQIHIISSLKDAEPVSGLKMILALEENSTFALYTGPIKVCKVHVSGGVSEIMSTSRWQYNLISGTPRRSSLQPNSKGFLELKFKEEMLSPVTGITDSSIDQTFMEDDSSFEPNSCIIALRDGIHHTVILESKSNDLFRVTLPKMATSDIVLKLLSALKCVLPKEVSSGLFSKWYAARNAPGSCDPTAPAELTSFLHCLLGMLGCDLETSEGDWSYSPYKKFKSSEQGSDEDWASLSSWRTADPELDLLGLHPPKAQSWMYPALPVNPSPLTAHLPLILYTLHMVYEDSKLNLIQWSHLPQMAKVLHHLAGNLRLVSYQDHYWRDFPDYISSIQVNSAASPRQHIDKRIPELPPNIFCWLKSFLSYKKQVDPFPYVPSVTLALRNIVTLLSYFRDGKTTTSERYLKKTVTPGLRVNEELVIKASSHWRHNLVLLITQLGYSLEDLECLPLGISLPIQEVLYQCRQKPPPDWPVSGYVLIRRPELCMLSHGHFLGSRGSHRVKTTNKKDVSLKDDEDGILHLDHNVLKLRFSRDVRVMEVYRMLQSSKPVRIALVQRPEVSDHEFIEEQEKFLYQLCIRTMALPLGRGMLTLRSCAPVVTEVLPIPKLCLTGRAPPRNLTVELTRIDVPANMNMWPLFHNGVAAGLRIVPSASQIHSTWIVYNKPRSNSNEAPIEHAGFLMGLGLNGHISNLFPMNVHDYLSKCHDLTSVGLLLGLCASKRGTMDLSLTKIMSIHLEALLPPTSAELDLAPMVQVAAVLGLGLLYQGSMHRHIAEVLLGEIGRPPGPEMEHCVDRESYALAAGLALGLVTLGKGEQMAALSDLPMANELYHFMVGGHKRPLTGVHKEKQKSPSYQIREGDSVNVDVTSPGATLALGMMFFNTGNRAVAEWMEIPDTQYLLDMVRPDFLMLRTISHSLILWDKVLPSKFWVESHLPEIVSTHALKKGQSNGDVDYETMSQVYCNVVAGACMSLGLKFAGSANEQAFNTLMNYARVFLTLSSNSLSEQAGKSTVETCLNVSVLAAAMVMAGTGDLEVLRICRVLRSRVCQTSNYVQYGSHMATHLALGLLFLGGGRYTLKTTPDAIGALLCAFFPKFPTHSNDNRYHLQAFRHLYVLAVEPRLLVPRDIDTGQVVYAHFRVVFEDTEHYKGVSYLVKGPCLLPELKYLKEVQVEDPRYWAILFDSRQNWKSLRMLLAGDSFVYVKQKAGCLPYTEDPKGYKSLLSQNLMQDTIHGWNVKLTSVSAFSCDPLVLHFSQKFLLPTASSSREQESELQKHLCSLLFECATMEKTEAFPNYLQLVQLLSNLKIESPLELWQLTLALEFIRKHSSQNLLNPDFALTVQSCVQRKLAQAIQGCLLGLGNYLRNQEGQASPIIARYLIFNGIPHLNFQRVTRSLPALYLTLKDLRLSTSVLALLLKSISE